MSISCFQPLANSLSPTSVRPSDPHDHLGRVRFDHDDAGQAVDKLVFFKLADCVEVSRGWGEHLHNDARRRRLRCVRVPAPAVDVDVGAADLSGYCLNASVACERPAAAPAELITQLRQDVDDDVVVDGNSQAVGYAIRVGMTWLGGAARVWRILQPCFLAVETTDLRRAKI